MVGTFLEPSRGRRLKPIHSIPYSVAQPLERGSNNYYSIIQGRNEHRGKEAPRIAGARSVVVISDAPAFSFGEAKENADGQLQICTVYQPFERLLETPEAAPMRGSCRRKATDEMGAGDPQPRKNGAALRPSRWGEGNYFFPAFAFSRLIWRRFLTASSIGWISPAACRAILVSSGPTSS